MTRNLRCLYGPASWSYFWSQSSALYKHSIQNCIEPAHISSTETINWLLIDEPTMKIFPIKWLSIWLIITDWSNSNIRFRTKLYSEWTKPYKRLDRGRGVKNPDSSRTSFMNDSKGTYEQYQRLSNCFDVLFYKRKFQSFLCKFCISKAFKRNDCIKFLFLSKSFRFNGKQFVLFIVDGIYVWIANFFDFYCTNHWIRNFVELKMLKWGFVSRRGR